MFDDSDDESSTFVDKDPVAKLARSLILTDPQVVETHFAELGMTTLSFQSLSVPQRHVWIDTDGEIRIDAEDWTYTETWDNSVGSIVAPDVDVLAKIVWCWLSGGSFGDCQVIGDALRGPDS
jgi:hypothetical protein